MNDISFGLQSHKIKIAIADDHAMFRQSMSATLEIAGLDVVMEASNGQELLDMLQEADNAAHPEIILMDLQMPLMDGFKATRTVRNRYPHIQVLAVSMFKGDHLIKSLVMAGASGFIQKEESIDVVLEAINAIRNKGYFLNEKFGLLKEDITETSSATSSFLSDREKQIIVLICEQKTILEIASDLALSPRTVESHRLSILRKTGTKNTAGIVKYAFTNNLIDPIF